MKILQNSIDEVRDRSDLRDVLQSFGVEFKGTQACCPYHTEKTPSFHLMKGERRYKCFGCGVSGDIFHFLMENQKMTFIESVQWLGNRYNIILEVDKFSETENEETKTERKIMEIILDWSHKKYRSKLHDMDKENDIIKYLAARGIDDTMINAWQLGYAPDVTKFITKPLLDRGQYTPGFNLGMIKTTKGNSYDFLRDRITIPIHDMNGKLIGISGRINPKNDKYAKYMNPSDSLIYKKSKVWFGLHAAKDAIREDNKVYITEGYFDVIALHSHDVCNVVCACGTSVSDDQAMLLKRFTKNIVLLLDGDEPGIKAADKMINLFLGLGCKISIIQLPDAQDPDEWIRSIEAEETQP